jgi:mono/diheme cytochrome c family protein
MTDVPAFLGELHAPNITSHPEHGIGRLRDDEIARALRFGVDHRGKKGIMGFGMADADLAAVIGFLRSDDPLFAPDPRPNVPTRLSLVGKTMLWLSGAADVPQRPATGLTAPERAPTEAYGRYLATEVFDCAGCHTPGFSSDKHQGDKGFAGGFAFTDPAGDEVHSPNITPHATGLGRWTREDFDRAMRDGVRRDGVPLRSPMPRFRSLDDVDMDALWVFLRGLPSRENQVPGHTPLATIPAAAATIPAAAPAAEDAASLFAGLGCVGCHGGGARYHQNLRAARGRAPADLARWIRNPESFRPGTPMPTYADAVTEETALTLARWISEGHAP